MTFRRAFRWLLFLGVVVAEPFCHLFGIPHPEGLSQQALNLLTIEES